MKTAADLRRAFAVYYEQMASCEQHGCYWALLHVLVVIPDICAALEGQRQGATRYVKWCEANFPAPSGTGRGGLQPGDRYQMRNALLHQGTTLPDNSRATKPDHKTQYSSFSFVDPTTIDAPVHQQVNRDTARGGDILTVDVKKLADETRNALEMWFHDVLSDRERRATVERNLPMMARKQSKVSKIPPPTPGGAPLYRTHYTTSST